MSEALLKSVSLKEGERFVLAVRRSLWSRPVAIFFAAIFMLLPFFLIYPLFSQGAWGATVFCLLLFIGLALSLRVYLSHRFTALLMTDFRLVDIEQKGFFHRAATEVLYEKIQDVSYRSQGLFNAIFKTGDVYVSFRDAKSVKLKLPALKNPAQVAAEIIERQRRALMSGDYQAKNKDRELLKKIRNRLGEEEFSRLIFD